MNNDIKRIILYLKNNTFIPDETKRKYKILHRDEVNKLLDYITNLQKTQETLIKNDNEIITNLQEENKKLKELCDKYEEEHSTAFNLWKTNIIKNVPALGDMQEQLKDYKSRIDKAIEYINNTTLFTEDYDYDYEENLVWNGATDEKEREELLNILKGEDKE